MDKDILHDRKIAILAAEGFDELQLSTSRKALEKAGANVVIVSLKKGQIIPSKKEQGKAIEADEALGECSSEIFDGLLIPDGDNYSDILSDTNVSNFIKEFAYDGKSIATIGNGTNILIGSGVTKKKTLTTWPTFKNQVLKSGAMWRDDEVVNDNGFVTSRCQNESPIFIKKMIECFSIGPHAKKYS